MATKTNLTNSTITITDGKLILSLPNAQTPVVWQMDLDKAKSSSFSIKENKKEKSFSLVSKNDSGQAEDIATFNDKETAVEVLLQTSEVLQNGSGKTQSSTTANAATSNKGGSDKLGAALAALLILALLVIWMTSASVPGKLSGISGVSSSASVNGSNDARSTSGVAVSAEDFLSNR